MVWGEKEVEVLENKRNVRSVITNTIYEPCLDPDVNELPENVIFVRTERL